MSTAQIKEEIMHKALTHSPANDCFSPLESTDFSATSSVSDHPPKPSSEDVEFSHSHVLEGEAEPSPRLITSPQYFLGLPLPLCISTTNPRTSSRALSLPLHMSKPSQSRLPQLVHHRGHSHLFPDNLVPNLIVPSVSTHPSQHPHFRDMHFLDMCVLDWPTLRSIQQDEIFLSHKTPEASLHFIQATPMRCVTSSSMSPPPWIIDPRYLKLSFRNDLCGKSHFHLCLLHHITEIAPQIFCFGPTQPEPFGLQRLSPHFQPRINFVPRFINQYYVIRK
ncbi:hypothetical protein H5410_032029 [Solanum commersonii]|uniref:Uncharacterized protein n=1 Tax=Solanum commersonii TaxID=4109 RepID=A0A9J5YIU0_SOLCO|nr:hypothetical protein H5410_032029 [Solanum commersonii]